MNGKDAFANLLSIVASTVENQIKGGKFHLCSHFQSVVSWVCCLWLFVRENIIVGGHSARKLITSRRLPGKSEARGRREVAGSQGQVTHSLKPLLSYSSLTQGWLDLICMGSTLPVAPRTENQAFHI